MRTPTMRKKDEDTHDKTGKGKRSFYRVLFNQREEQGEE